MNLFVVDNYTVFRYDENSQREIMENASKMILHIQIKNNLAWIRQTELPAFKGLTKYECQKYFSEVRMKYSSDIPICQIKSFIFHSHLKKKSFLK